MSTREIIQDEIAHLSDVELERLLALIRQILESREKPGTPGILSRLSQFSFDGPEDLSQNFDRYASRLPDAQ